MVKPVHGHDDLVVDVEHDPLVGPESPLSDQALPDLPDALVEEWGRVAAAQTLGVNHRAPAICGDSRQVFRRTRLGLVDCRHAGWFAR